MEIFEHMNFKGGRTVYSGSVPSVKYNNRMSALKVPKGCCVTIFELVNFGGKHKKYCGINVKFVGRWWNDKMSSLKVSEGEGECGEDGKPCEEVHPCDKPNKGGCSDKCEKEGANAKCVCNEGRELSTDGKTCTESK